MASFKKKKKPLVTIGSGSPAKPVVLFSGSVLRADFSTLAPPWKIELSGDGTNSVLEVKGETSPGAAGKYDFSIQPKPAHAEGKCWFTLQCVWGKQGVDIPFDVAPDDGKGGDTKFTLTVTPEGATPAKREVILVRPMKMTIVDKLRKFLAWQSTLCYGPDMVKFDGEKRRFVNRGESQWEIIRGANYTVSSTGKGPSIACSPFGALFTGYWFNFGQAYRPIAGASANDLASVFKGFVDPLGSMSWETVYETMLASEAKDPLIYVCASEGHVWLLARLRGGFTASKAEVLAGAGGSDSCAGIYKIHAGPRPVPPCLGYSVYKQDSLGIIRVVMEHLNHIKEGDDPSKFVDTFFEDEEVRKETASAAAEDLAKRLKGVPERDRLDEIVTKLKDKTLSPEEKKKLKKEKEELAKTIADQDAVLKRNLKEIKGLRDAADNTTYREPLRKALKKLWKGELKEGTFVASGVQIFAGTPLVPANAQIVRESKEVYVKKLKKNVTVTIMKQLYGDGTTSTNTDKFRVWRLKSECLNPATGMLQGEKPAGVSQAVWNQVRFHGCFTIVNE